MHVEILHELSDQTRTVTETQIPNLLLEHNPPEGQPPAVYWICTSMVSSHLEDQIPKPVAEAFQIRIEHVPLHEIKNINALERGHQFEIQPYSQHTFCRVYQANRLLDCAPTWPAARSIALEAALPAGSRVYLRRSLNLHHPLQTNGGGSSWFEVSSWRTQIFDENYTHLAFSSEPKMEILEKYIDWVKTVAYAKNPQKKELEHV